MTKQSLTKEATELWNLINLDLNYTLSGHGGGQVVSVLAFYSDNPSSNPAGVDNFSVILLLIRLREKKRPKLAHLR